MSNKLLFDHPMTAKEQWEFWQNQAETLEENAPNDEEEKEMIKEWRSYRIEDFKDETEEEFKKRQNNVEKINKAVKEESFKGFMVDEYGNQKEVKPKQIKPMTINTNIIVINKIKEKANDIGINYQSLINVLLKQYADGKIKITL